MRCVIFERFTSVVFGQGLDDHFKIVQNNFKFFKTVENLLKNSNFKLSHKSKPRSLEISHQK
jgi:hypothetical protein